MKTFKERIAELGLKYGDFSQELGYSLSYISAVVCGRGSAKAEAALDAYLTDLESRSEEEHMTGGKCIVFSGMTKSHWETYEEHAKFRTEEDERPWLVARDHFREEITELNENRLTGDYIKWFEPKDETDKLDDVQFRYGVEYALHQEYMNFSDYSYDEEMEAWRERNFIEAMEVMENAETVLDLGLVAKYVFELKEKHQWRDRHGKVRPGRIFPYDKENDFWNTYRMRKVELAAIWDSTPERKALIDEIAGLITEQDNEQDLVVLRREIGKTDLSTHTRQLLQQRCDTRTRILKRA